MSLYVNVFYEIKLIIIMIIIIIIILCVLLGYRATSVFRLNKFYYNFKSWAKKFHQLEKIQSAVAKGLRHHFTLVFGDPEYTVADISSDVAKWQTHPRDIWLAERECNLQIKNNTQHKQCQLGTTQQHLLHALHSANGSNRHGGMTYCAARLALGKQVFSTAHTMNTWYYEYLCSLGNIIK